MFFVNFLDRYLNSRQVAIMLMVFAVISFPTMDVMAKYLSQTQPPMQVVWARYTGQFILILLIFINRLGEVATTTQPGLQLSRSIALFGGTFFFFTSLSYMQIGKVAAIFQVAPVIITLMAVMFLKETIGIRRIISLIGGFVGALIIIQPEAGFFELAAFLPMLAATCYAGYSVLTRLLKPGETANTTLFYTAGFGAVVSTAILPFIWQTPQSYFEILLMASMSLFGGFGHYCVIQALMRAEATELAPLNYLAMVFAMIWGFLFFAEIPNSATLSGAALIVASGLYLWRRSQQVGKVAQK